MPQPVVEVRGLAQFRRDLRSLDRKYRAGLDRELKRAAQPIARAARAAYRRIHPRRAGGKGSQRGIRAAGGAAGVRVVLGGSRYPYLLGQEWGGRQPQFPAPARGGYFFWPAIRDGADDVAESVQVVIDRANALDFGD